MVLRVLWAIPVADLGGVARHALDVAEVGVPGVDVGFLVPPGPLGAALRARGAEVHTDDFGPAAGVRRSGSALRRAIAARDVQVVHTHLAYADVIGALATPRGVALVTTEHGIAGDDLVYHGSGATSRAMAVAHHLRLRRFDAVIAVARATAAAMREKWHPRQPITVIANGVDPWPASPAAPRPVGEPVRIVSLSRLSAEKRLDALVAGFATLAGHGVEAHLTLAGSGPLEADLRGQAERAGLADRVAFPGHVDAGAAMAEADVVAQLSVWENCSYTLLDAAARGLGVVATAVGGNPEILPERCLLADTRPETVGRALAHQARTLADRPSLRAWPSRREMTAAIAEVYVGLRSGPTATTARGAA